MASKYFLLYPLFALGRLVYFITGHTPWLSYWSMRQLYCADWANRSDDKKSKSTFIKNYSHGSLFKYDRNQIMHADSELRERGFHVLPFQLSEEVMGELETIARHAPCDLSGGPAPGSEKFDLANPLAPKYEVPEKILVQSSVVRMLARDSYFLNIAHAYLGSKPVNDLITMWWNVATLSPNLKEIAQEYHFDLDRIKFLKFFFYLTDVDEKNGPHCFIEGSHIKKPIFLREDRRYTNEEILQHYGKASEKTFVGKRGLILAEDTSGFHKGLPLIQGHRLMFQLEYSRDLFGQSFFKTKRADLSPSELADFSLLPHEFQRFLKGWSLFS